MNKAATRLASGSRADEPHGDFGWLLGQLQHGYQAAAVAAYGDLPGGMKGFHVLDAAVEGTARNQIEVARRFGIDRTVMVRLVDDLERAGLVERRADPADRRARTIAVTAAGHVRHADVRQRLDRVGDHVLGPLSGAERETFTALLRRVVAWLVAIDPTHGEAACNAVREQLSTPVDETACPAGVVV